MKTIWKEWKSCPKAILLELVGIACGIVSTSIGAWMIILISDVFSGVGDISSQLLQITMLMLLDIVAYTCSRLCNDTAFRLVFTSSMDRYINKILDSDYAMFTVYSEAYINNASGFINGAATIGNMIYNIIDCIVDIVVTVIAMAYIGGNIIIPVIAVYGAGFLLFKFMYKKYGAIESRRKEYMKKREQELEDTIDGFREVRIFNTQKIHKDSMHKLNWNIYREGHLKSALNAKLNASILGVTDGGVITVILYALKCLADRAITQSQAMSLIMFVTKLGNPIISILDFAYVLTEARAFEDEYKSVMEYESKLSNNGEKELKCFKDKVEIKNLSFSYDSKTNILKNINMTIPKGSKVAIVGVSGGGKMQPDSTRIPTPDGWKMLGDIKAGDTVFSIDGMPTKVNAVFKHKNKPVFRVKFGDGRYSLAGEAHLWKVLKRSHNCWKEEVMSTYEIYQECFANGESKRSRYCIPVLAAPVQYKEQAVPIDPYVLGVFIGNGCLMERYLTLSSGDPVIPEKIAEITGFSLVKYSDKNYSYCFKNKDGSLVQTKEFFRDLPCAVGYSCEKVLPDEYVYNSVDVRMGVLQGLFDTDGSICEDKNGTSFPVQYTSTSKALLMQIQEIVRSLGYTANISVDKRFHKYRSKWCGSITLQAPHGKRKQFFRYSRHKLMLAEQAELLDGKPNKKKYDKLYIKGIEYECNKDCTCISVDHPSEMYITDQFIPTHNTTLFKILMKFHEAIEGEVLIDGTNINELSNETYFQRVGAVLQQNVIYPCSLRKNILYAKPDASDEELMDACQKAEILEFALNLEDGLDTIVGPNGVKLSGGQCQRIALARMFLRDPDIILLDEATSALDSQTEHSVLQAVDTLCGGKTTITITHRLSTIENSDYIYVFNENGIAEEGTPEDLVKKQGEYWKMLNAMKQ